MSINFVKYVVIALLLMLLSSCGGGSGGDAENSEQSNDQSVNNNLTGYLFSEESGDKAYLVDLSTGIASIIPNTDWENQDERFPYGIARYYKYSVQNSNSQFVGLAVNCKGENPDPLATSMSCIFFQDYSGNYLGQIDLLYDVSNVELSPDGQYLALFRNFNPGVSGQEWFEVFTIDGRFLSDRRLRARNIQWLFSGGIVYGDGRRFVFTKPYSTDTDYSLILPDSIGDGWISDFDTSSDQSQIVFTYASESTAFTSVEAKLYIMNTDGTNVRLLADVPANETANITDPTWSPNGNWIILEEGNIEGQDQNVPGTAGYIYIVPSENLGKVFILSVDDSKRSQEVIQVWHDQDGAGPSETLSLRSSGRRYEWIP